MWIAFPLLICLAGLAIAGLPPAFAEDPGGARPQAAGWARAAMPVVLVLGTAALVVLVAG
jgi:hypothetical protein